ncbi:heat-inducible transcriptional repressor HrcA [Ornithinimicrobium pekingense]|uniref:Heat-inducible transcription repressor HrcA n=1 Tax=Ornithinimicrobium pekingense TaxID=384677 RepID=A0ABQ2F8I9_9MICO|nr:heat-inducible transcriptional repressor HrcA [Ornithinimicrobium pekingense]GGK61685.1 heat-inducible transcription repressor HrcA [Ornithinimicrobium pekingense]
MSDDRRLEILRAIVQDYVRTSEPVGSKALLERHQLGVSAATVRNDMAVLEEEGLITAPHTSAGRVPTDAGYRMFVDRLSAVKPLTRAERTAIERFLHGAVDLDDVVTRTTRLLSSLTHQVAVMQYPSLSRSSVRHIELVPVGGTRLMVVLIVNTGRVEQRVIDVGRDLTGQEALVADLRARVNGTAVGEALTAVPDRLVGVVDAVAPEDRPVASAVAAALRDALEEQAEERVVLSGTANLARVNTDFPTSLSAVLDALEEHVVLLRLMGSLSSVPDADRVAVSIGAENPYAPLRTTSVVATSYGVAGGLGVLGPTRMDYPQAMAAVRAVAHYVAEILDG